jgi:hypothetical protein
MNFHYHNHITLGFAGKRKDDNLSIIADRLAELFSAFDEKFKDHHIHFVSGLADGADQIASNVFVKRYIDGAKRADRSIGALIPFEKTEYLNTIDDKPEFERLYAQCGQKLELDGLYEPAQDDILEKAYQQQGHVLCSMCDVLIAAAPKSTKGGEIKPGGTIESIIHTLNLNKPVIFLNLADKQFYLYCTLEEWFSKAEKISIDDLVKELKPKHVKTVDEKSDEFMSNGPVFILRRWLWQLFEKIFKGKKNPAKAPRKIEDDQKPNGDTEVTPMPPNELQVSLLASQNKLDKLAIYFQYQYRGGYILNYVLALIAIFLAVGSSVFLIIAAHAGDENVHVLMLIIDAVKIVILLLLLYNTWRIKSKQYNKQAIDYRYAAERLRINGFIAGLGILRSPAPSLGNHSRKRFLNYSGENIYQKTMEEPLKQHYTLKITKNMLRHFTNFFDTHCIQKQIGYHNAETQRMEKMHGRLEKLPGFFSYLVIVFVLIELVTTYFVKIDKLWCSMDEAFELWVPILLGFTAFLPAIITTFNSIHFQSDAKRMTMRSALMESELIEQQKNIHKIKMDRDGSNFFKVYSTVDDAARVLTDEVAEWSLIYEKQVYEL